MIELFDRLEITSKQMEELTGIDRYKWGNIRGRKQKVNEDYLAALAEAFPQFAYWLMTGLTLPEAGQISPEMEKAHSENSLKTG
ncbi:DNA-binding protein [Marinobacter xestospongiae]|uniref:DNA-binding protein n=1 Tax=Marinobacter xestospongiae TaxID=994319 RepID=UPI002002D2AD|nr:DNA-binding protein [Marinobacter xestospongiae]